MGEFVDVTLSRVPEGFEFFDPLRQLFHWVEDQGFVVVGEDGDLYGSLSSDDSVGTSVLLRGYPAEETAAYVRSWFGLPADDSIRVWPFARTGADGSMTALWLDDDRQTRIVHLGSGSGSLLTCVLADNAIDFLRLLAIGYREVCWSDEFAAPPQPWDEDSTTVNAPFREWLVGTFGVTIPETALEIVREPAGMDDPETNDPFLRWVKRLQDERYAR